MKKNNFKKLALLGLTSGIVLSHSLDAADKAAVKDVTDEYNAGNLGYHEYTEDELLLELNADGQKMYKELSPEGKKLARETASKRCNGTNECKGLNACKTDDHDCAGKGACKGKGKCALADKNLAVRLVHIKMAAKRAEANGK